ncbi:hypothetical protein Airi01_098440 [Actinoallomurus iriomotensis]|uniref:Uncharacterized protein n=1 Tax=Actinoallomurus iriomotensis TaxID=478107 RepID=A0A9W6VWG3_9ACTN|nr:hypothetical protein Airi01_098440 [Actinoallomurus iriomotensis]
MTNALVAEYLAARSELRHGRELPLMTAERRAALLLAESLDGTWPTQRRDAGFAFVQRQLREAWSWEVADQYHQFPRNYRRGPALLVKPTGKCGNCGTSLRDGQVTFCSQRCRMRFKRHGPGSAVRHCRGCKQALPASWTGVYCILCCETRAADTHLAMDDVWESKPCAVPGCEGVAEAMGERGRPPKFCCDCATPAARARRRRAAKKAGAR